MIRKLYDDLLDLCEKELHPRGFLLQELSSSSYLGIPNIDSRGNVWTKEGIVPSDELDFTYQMVQIFLPNTTSDNVKLRLEGRTMPLQLIHDWKKLEVRIFEIDRGSWALVASDAFYANRALITKISHRKGYSVGEKPPFPVHDCKIVLLEKGLLNDTLPVIRYRGALDLHSYEELLSSHQGGSKKQDKIIIDSLRQKIKSYADNFEVILDGFTRREQYSLGLDPLRTIKI
ncbi:MAG: hypothetical protein AABX24_03780 [Nanoarchaeota archaeon]